VFTPLLIAPSHRRVPATRCMSHHENIFKTPTNQLPSGSPSRKSFPLPQVHLRPKDITESSTQRSFPNKCCGCSCTAPTKMSHKIFSPTSCMFHTSSSVLVKPNLLNFQHHTFQPLSLFFTIQTLQYFLSMLKSIQAENSSYNSRAVKNVNVDRLSYPVFPSSGAAHR